MRDCRILFATSFLRSAGVGFASAVLAVHLDRRGFGAAAVGAAVAAGLAGGAVSTGLVSLFGDRFGRRRTLWVLAAFGGAGGLALAAFPGFAGVLAAAFMGMVNGMGHDRGGAYTLEQSALSHEPGVHARTAALGWYHALGDLGCAAGSLAAALVPAVGYRWLWLGYAGACGAGVFLYPFLSRAVESPDPRAELTAETRRRVTRFAGLSALDSLGSGFLTGALVSYFFYKRFGVQEGGIAVLFLAADAANLVSNFVAVRLARSIGLVNTMVFTHIPASVSLMLMPLAPNFPVAAGFFLLREFLVEMDVPTRQSYLASIVQPHERTAALGVVQLTRTAMWAVAPGFAGWLIAGGGLGAPLVAGCSMKICYDLLLWRAFRRLRPED